MTFALRAWVLCCLLLSVTACGKQSDTVVAIAPHPRDPDLLYVATTVGVFRSKDGGRLWEERMYGMKEVHYVVTLAMDPHNPDVMYAGTTGGVYKTTDGTAHWEKVNNGLIPKEKLDAAMD